MKITIIKEDRLITIDGEALNFDYTLDDNIWAIQWNGSSGEVEYNDGSPNEPINSFTEYQYLVDAFNVEKQRLVDVETQQAADAEAALTYADRRRDAYPETGEQFDLQYWDKVNGTSTWQDAILAVKNEFPKT